MKGIDVSKHNGVINWTKVKQAGIQFAIIRGGFGQHHIDECFKANMEGAILNGLYVGVYWFSYATSVQDAINEAVFCDSVISAYKGKLLFPVAFDWEYDSDNQFVKEKGRSATVKEITDMTIAFLDKMKSLGYCVMNYLNNDYRKNRLDMSRLSQYDIWLADYTGAPDVACAIQQTSESGVIAGIDGNQVDMDISFKDYPTYIKSNGLNGFTKEQKKEDDPMEKIYHYTIEVPAYARPTIQKLLDKGYYKGASDADLDLPETVMRTLVVLDRAGVFDK